MSRILLRMISAVVALCAVILAWLAWWALGLDLGPPIVTSVVAVGVVVGHHGLRIFRARRSARRLEAALSGETGDLKGIRPDQRAELMELKQKFAEALGRLRQAGGPAGLTSTPWFLILGPPGSGKSTLLRGSGLGFAGDEHEAVRGVGGTRNCDFWLGNQAVFLDTAGRWSTDDDDVKEWLAFVDLLKSERVQSPLNGVVVAISVDDLINPERLGAFATQLRERLNEVLSRLEMELPVYLMVTKCDLLPGFTDSFCDLAREDRSSIWGLTAPWAAPVERPHELVRQRFDELVERLQARTLYRVTETRHLVARELAFSFADQFAHLREPLVWLVEQLFRPNIFRETPIMRGVYFSSGTQEGSPIDTVLCHLAHALGVRSPALESPVQQKKVYFVEDVFTQVLMPDAKLATVSAKVRRKRRRSTLIAAAVLALSAVFVLVLPVQGFFNGRALHKSLERGLETAQAAFMVQPSESAGQDPFLSRRSAATLVEGLRELQATSFVDIRLGMAQSERLSPSYERLVAKVMKERVIRPLVAREAATLRAFAQDRQALGPSAELTREDYERIYNALRRYLVLTQPEPPVAVEGELASALVEAVVKRWTAEVDGPATNSSESSVPPELDGAPELVAVYLEHLVRDRSSFVVPFEPTLLTEAQRSLASAPIETILVDTILARVGDRFPSLTLVSMMGRAVPTMHAEHEVRGAFTRDAFEGRVRTMFEQPLTYFSREPWVLGEDAPDVDILSLRGLYFRRYIEEWDQFVSGIEIDVPSDEAARTVLTGVLSRGEPAPLQALLHHIHRNVRLDAPQTFALPSEVTNPLERLSQRLSQEISRLGPAARVVASAQRAAIREQLNRPLSERMRDPSARVMALDVEAHFRGLAYFQLDESRAHPGPQDRLVQYQEDLTFVVRAETRRTERLDDARRHLESSVTAAPAAWQARLRRLFSPPFAPLASAQ